MRDGESVHVSALAYLKVPSVVAKKVRIEIEVFETGNETRKQQC